MEPIDDLLDLARRLVPFLATLAGVIVVLAASHVVLNRRWGDQPHARFKIQLILLALTVIGLLAVVLALTHDNSELRGQLLSFLGILLSAAIALSSTTILGNALAGILLRLVAGFGIGDFIRVGESFGRVSERGVLHTEIQTEDRDLTTLPNLYLVTHPVRVLRASGTIISSQVSLGYDVPRHRIEEALQEAAKAVKLEEPFVHILELGDFSVTYRVAGLLTEVKNLLSTRSALNAAVLDALHRAQIEIVSPNFMNTRALVEGHRILPPDTPAPEPQAASASAPEALVFDKAEEAEKAETLIERRRELEAEIESLRQSAKTVEPGPQQDQLKRKIAEFETAYEQLGRLIEEARQRGEE